MGVDWMEKLPVWDPFKEWHHANISWIKVDISKEDMKKFTERNNLKGLIQTFSFLLIIAITASFSYYAFTTHNWILLAVGLYLHGMIYGHFGAGIHELTHNTVFESKFLNKAAVMIFGLLYWPYNPYFYRISHVHYHHQYTLHQNSDGEDTPNYVELNKMTIFSLFFRALHIKSFIQCVGRLFTLKPLSKNWRMRGYQLDKWEKFILEKATEKERKEVNQFTVFSLIFHVLFVTACILSGYWFLAVLITLAPFYGPGAHGFMCGIHQHACCEANNPDFRKSCGDAILDPISSILYWHMEYHTEHHMFAGIPCYNLKKFSTFVAEQMPKKEYAIPHIIKLAGQSREIFGSKEDWRENFGRYKGF
jgi:fatty acid desaturase